MTLFQRILRTAVWISVAFFGFWAHEKFVESVFAVKPYDLGSYPFATVCWYSFANPGTWALTMIVGGWLHWSQFPFADGQLQTLFWANVLGILVCRRSLLDARGRANSVGRFVASTAVSFEGNEIIEAITMVGVGSMLYVYFWLEGDTRTKRLLRNVFWIGVAVVGIWMHEDQVERILLAKPLHSWSYLATAACWYAPATPGIWAMSAIAGAWLHWFQFPFQDSHLQTFFWANVLGVLVCWRSLADRRGRAICLGRLVTATAISFQSDNYLMPQILLVGGVWCVIYGMYLVKDELRGEVRAASG